MHARYKVKMMKFSKLSTAPCQAKAAPQFAAILLLNMQVDSGSAVMYAKGHFVFSLSISQKERKKRFVRVHQVELFSSFTKHTAFFLHSIWIR